MNLENAYKTETSFLFVSLFSGVIIFIYLLYFLSYGMITCNIVDFLPILDNKYYNTIILFIISYIFGMFIHGIRYVGFMQYKKLYDKGIKNRWTRLLFYLFRKATTVEECYDLYRDEKCSYNWIVETRKKDKKRKQGRKAVAKMWQLAAKIDKEQNIYQFYFYSEIFECCNTIFLFMGITQGLMILYNLYPLIYEYNSNLLFNVRFKAVLFFMFLLLHFLSQRISIAYADRFIYDIDIKKDIRKH